MLKTVITDVFVAQVYWEAVPKTWRGGSKASVAKCVVRPFPRCLASKMQTTSSDIMRPRDVVGHVTIQHSIIHFVWKSLIEIETKPVSRLVFEAFSVKDYDVMTSSLMS